MPKVAFQAVKMSKAAVSHISLVERGANRIPFKVVKEEQNMSGLKGLDLGALFGRQKSEADPQAEILAVVTMKGETLPQVTTAIEAAGFSVGKSEELEDGSVVFHQGEGSDLDNTEVIRLNDHVALVTKGFSPYSMSVLADGVSFADQCAAKGFYPGVNAIMETLSDTIRSIVQNASSPAEAKTAVSKLMSEASAYVSSFILALPPKAFGLDNGISYKAEVIGGDDDTQAEAAAAEAAKAEEIEKAAKAAANSIKCPECGAENPADAKTCDNCGADLGMKAKKEESEEGSGAAAKAEADVSAMVSAKVAEAVATPLSEIVSRLDGMVATIQEVQKSVSGLGDGLASVTARVEAAEEVVKSAKDAVAGTLTGIAASGDPAPQVARKNEMRGPVEFDTAFTPGVRRPRARAA